MTETQTCPSCGHSHEKSVSDNSTKTRVVFLLDRTGSMQAIKSDTIGGFNEYLATLQGEGAENIRFTMMQFDSTSIDVLHRDADVKKVPKLTEETFRPRANTPLYDAAFRAINEANDQVQEGEKVVICIMTDGYENASKEVNLQQLKSLIEEKQGLGWQFNFMGAGLDAYEIARGVGISSVNTMSYNHQDKESTQRAFTASAMNTRSFAKGESATTEYSSIQRREAGDAWADRYKEELDK